MGMMLAVDLSYTAFIMFSYVPSIPTLLRVFIVNGSWILSKAFSASINMPPQNKSHLSMLYGLFIVLLDLIC